MDIKSNAFYLELTESGNIIHKIWALKNPLGGFFLYVKRINANDMH